MAIVDRTTRSSRGVHPDALLRAMAGRKGTNFGPGPWVEAFGVLAPFPLRSKANARRYTRGRRPAPGDDTKALAAFEDRLRTLLSASVPPTWDRGPSKGAVALRPAVVCVLAARTTLDAGNMPKSVHDAAQQVVVHTDAAIAASLEVALRTTSDPAFAVGFARLDPTASPAELLDALGTLAPLTVALLETPSADRTPA